MREFDETGYPIVGAVYDLKHEKSIINGLIIIIRSENDEITVRSITKNDELRVLSDSSRETLQHDYLGQLLYA